MCSPCIAMHDCWSVHVGGQPLPTSFPKNIGEYEAFLESRRVPVSGLLHKNLTSKFPIRLAEKLLDMGSDQSFLVSHITSSIELSLSSTLPPGGSLCLLFKLFIDLTLFYRELRGDGVSRHN